MSNPKDAASNPQLDLNSRNLHGGVVVYALSEGQLVRGNVDAQR